MRLLTGFILIICLTILITASGFAELVVEKSDSQGSYDFTWGSTPFAEALRDLNAQFEIQSFTQIMDNERAPSANGIKGQLLSIIAMIMGNCFGRSYSSIGTTPVFRPIQPQTLSGPSGEREMVAGQLIASFTPQQIKMHKSKSLLPFAQLTEKQQQQVSYLVRTFTHHTQFPEPELSQRLQQSAVIMTIVPEINGECDYIDGKGQTGKFNSGFYCDRNFSQDFWMAKAAGQLEAYHLNTASMTNPGADVPGDAEVHSLDGTYTLAGLLKMVKDSSGDIRVDGDPDKIRFEAHCDFTSASIARACAIATGMNWHREKDGWYLASDSIAQITNPSMNCADLNIYINEYDKQLPAIQKMAYQGNMILAIDKVWQKVNLNEMLDADPLLWDDLSPEQQSYLKVGAEMYSKTPGLPDMAPYLPKMKLTWHPNIKLYVVTNGDALYVEWLRFEPMSSPDGPKRFYGKRKTAESSKSK